MRGRLIVLAAAALIGGVQAKEGVNSDEVLKAQPTTKKQFFSRKVVEDVKISGKTKYLAGTKQFIVPCFRITFLTDSKYSNEVGGVTKSKTKVTSDLVGVSDDEFQAITEAIYADFVESCRAAGYEVAEHSTNKGVANWKMKKSYPYNKSGKVHTLPKGTIFQEGFTPPAMKIMMADQSTVMVSVDLTVNFVINNRNQKKFTFGNKAAVETSQGISVGGQLTINNKKTSATVKLGQPVYSDKAFGKVANSTKKSDKVGDVAHGIGQWAFGGGLGNRKKTTRATVNADPALYSEAAKDALGSVNATFVDALGKITSP